MTSLNVRNLSVIFESENRRVNAVRDVSFNLEVGEKLGFVGESGSGKTTSALALMGLIPRPGRIAAGSALLGSTDLLQLGADEIRRERLKNVSYIPQGAMNSLNPVQRVRDSILDGMIDHGVQLKPKEAKDFVAELLEDVGLSPDVARRYPHELSGGMKQRVCIAVAIALKPKLLIADEPTSALDVITQRQIMQTLGKVQKELGSSLMLIGHDMGLMAQFVDRLIVMRRGRIVENGKTANIFKAPQAEHTRKLISSVPAIPTRRTVVASAAAQQLRGNVREDDTLLELDAVSKTYSTGFMKPEFTALHPMSLRFSKSQPKIIAMVGQSGSGKTTCGTLMLGFQKPSTGRVIYDGVNVAKMNQAQRKEYRCQVQAVFQDPYASFNPFYTVDHAFLIPLRRFGVVQDRAEAYDVMAQALQDVGLDPKAIFGAYAHQLSGGQRQRLMVARALALKPKLIVADEPVSMVDASLRATILDNIRRLRDEHGISVLYITHDLATAYRSSDGVIVLHKGHVVEAGPPEPVICDPQHPYSRLLVDSIPSTDPDRKWAGGRDLNEDQLRAGDAGQEQAASIRGAIPGFEFHVG